MRDEMEYEDIISAAAYIVFHQNQDFINFTMHPGFRDTEEKYVHLRFDKT